jgi:hypothetical protein
MKRFDYERMIIYTLIAIAVAAVSFSATMLGVLMYELINK